MTRYKIKAGDYIDTSGMTVEEIQKITDLFLAANVPFGYTEKTVVFPWKACGWSETLGHFVRTDIPKQEGLANEINIDQLREADLAKYKPEWDGTGLPPVGSVVEVVDGVDWVSCKIVAHVKENGSTDAIYQLTDKESWDWCDSPNHFRPLRTERDKAIDEMNNIMTTLYQNSESPTPSQTLSMSDAEAYFGAIYDAGYRKP